MEPAGRIALVTGGARRVGRAFSLALAEAGCDVVVNYNGSADEAAVTAADIERLGRRALPVHADISRPDDIARLVRETEQAFGRLDIVVNNASLFERAPVPDITVEDWDRVLNVNLRGPFFLAQAAAPLLRRDGGGLIVNIVDLSALQPWPSFAHHAVSKAGLLHLTRVLARALAPDIRVNAIAPGTVLPPEDTEGEDGSERRVLARSGEPADVTSALLYLVRSDFVTGENLVVDGGRMLL
ncbi:MAG TPA: SDR family oxidoreductase [Longimicrobiales bacterium]|nr:SDR family oxidoreductase [Longimicrobiales bacterium]